MMNPRQERIARLAAAIGTGHVVPAKEQLYGVLRMLGDLTAVDLLRLEEHKSSCIAVDLAQRAKKNGAKL
jgi:hypothetical protein